MLSSTYYSPDEIRYRLGRAMAREERSATFADDAWSEGVHLRGQRPSTLPTSPLDPDHTLRIAQAVAITRRAHGARP